MDRVRRTLKGKIKNIELPRTDILTVEEAAEVAGLTRSGIYDLARRGQLAMVFLDGRKYVFLSELLDYLAKKDPIFFEAYAAGQKAAMEKIKEIEQKIQAATDLQKAFAFVAELGKLNAWAEEEREKAEQKHGKSYADGWEKGFIMTIKQKIEEIF